MELLPEEEELETLSPISILRASITIPRHSPKTFSLITLTLVFPLSFAVLAHTLFTHPILQSLAFSSFSSASSWLLLFLYQFLYLLLLFTFSLLSTAAVVFTVASLHAARPAVSFRSTLSAVPPVFSRLFHTFIWFSAVMAVYHLLVVSALLPLFLLPTTLFWVLLPILLLAFLAVHVFIAAVWHLACVVAVLEPVCGLAAMWKSRDLIRGKEKTAALLVLTYLSVSGVLSGLFRFLVVRSGDEVGLWTKVVVGGVLVAVLVVVNMVGLLVQSLFYYICKSYHHQAIDRTSLSEHLGGYLGEYVPLKSDVQMETL